MRTKKFVTHRYVRKALHRVALLRIIEFTLGVVLATLLVSRYQDAPGNGKYLLEYLIPWKPLFVAATIFLFAVAARLIAGKPKDYSKSFFRLMVKMFGLPQKK